MTTGMTATASVLDARWAIDTVGPTVAAPATAFVSPATLGASAVTARIAWPAATDDAIGVASAGLEQSVNGGAWSAVVAGPPATEFVASLTVGATYRFRVVALDWAGNASYAEGPPVRAVRYQESTAAIRYRGTWYRFSSSSASGGRTKYTSRARNSATFRFTGQAVAFVAPTSRSRGSAKIYVDGAYVRTVSLYSRTSRARQIVFAQSWAASGAHSVRVLVVGTRGHPRVDVDAFVILR